MQIPVILNGTPALFLLHPAPAGRWAWTCSVGSETYCGDCATRIGAEVAVLATLLRMAAPAQAAETGLSVLFPYRQRKRPPREP